MTEIAERYSITEGIKEIEQAFARKVYEVSDGSMTIGFVRSRLLPAGMSLILVHSSAEWSRIGINLGGQVYIREMEVNVKNIPAQCMVAYTMTILCASKFAVYHGLQDSYLKRFENRAQEMLTWLLEQSGRGDLEAVFQDLFELDVPDFVKKALKIENTDQEWHSGIAASVPTGDR